MKLPFKFKKSNGQGKTNEILSDNSKFAIIEGYKNARANLMFSLSANENNCVAVTSWSKGEGKSTASANLAISFSKTGKKVLLIDADLRRPNVHLLTKLGNEKGFTDVLCKMSTFEKVVHKEAYPNLDVLTSGKILPNPSELLCSPVLAPLMDEIKKTYDYIIFDTPPVGVVSDALLLKPFVCGYVAVVKERSTTHGDVEKMKRSINLAESKILGFLKVGCQRTAKRGGKYGDYYAKRY